MSPAPGALAAPVVACGHPKWLLFAQWCLSRALSRGALAWRARAAAAALCTHTAMFRSGDSLCLAVLVRKHFLCSLLVFCALWVLRAPLGLVCITGCTARAEGVCFGVSEIQLNASWQF